MNKIKRYTVCYIRRNDGKILFLERNKKQNDINHGKFIGVGGKIESNETPDECIKREVLEEVNLELQSFNECGTVRYIDNEGYDEMYVYYCDEFTGEVGKCNEGTPHWLTYEEFLEKPHWEGDEIFLEKALFGKNFGSIEFRYDKNGKIIS